MKCKICQSSSSLFGQAKVLQKYPVKYYRCENCSFIQTEQPYWLDDAYSNAITKSDIGLISRNLQMAAHTNRLILTCFDPADKFIDYGGGYGMFVRLMRDQGFDFYRYDPLCENLFADGFDLEHGITYDLLTAWEVFEHLPNPLDEFEKMLSYSPNIFFSTQVLPLTPKPLGSWWYYGLEHGQHISFYGQETIQFIAKRLNIKLYYSDDFLHFMGKTEIRPILIKTVFNKRLSFLQEIFSKPQPKSLIPTDYEKITGITLE